jgi:hypothetical protein
MNPFDLLRPDGCDVTLPTHPVRALGIDLGTTNSTIAEIVWRPSQSDVKVRCLEVDQETPSGTYTHSLVPSAVAIHDGKMVVGEGAKRLLARAAEFGLERDKSLFLECKNDMGVRRTYHKAPDGFRSAPEIGGKVLSFLKEAATTHDPTPADRTAVTVPASFQAAQRLDTVKAASSIVAVQTAKLPPVIPNATWPVYPGDFRSACPSSNRWLGLRDSAIVHPGQPAQRHLQRNI